jgi:hypothetical protein
MNELTAGEFEQWKLLFAIRGEEQQKRAGGG